MIRWSATSVADLESIRDYISNDSEAEAIRFLKEIKVKVMEIPDFPFLGRVVPEMNDENIREIIFGNYRIIYGIQDDLIKVHTIFHHKRKF
ncbi:MAG: type II toxin-antitoxin system mRNA interferase toxin, RelE/StbE family [Candidatus Lokiarchaeota archaeon]|nr:type II toxin-antitoxin system mRNA interferase toxin, RelE/StbE family [Candidatus Lokiarchaeota archaeon]